MVCSSGITCTVYEPEKASTVHSHYGLGVADLPWKQLVERATNNSVVVKRVSESDVLIWDEASMSSQRMLEIKNAIHHRLSENGDKTKPFGGKQIILVGDYAVIISIYFGKIKWLLLLSFYSFVPYQKLWCNPYQLISSSSKASRIKELHAERKETVFEFNFPVFVSSVTRLVLHYKGASKCSRGVVGKE